MAIQDGIKTVESVIEKVTNTTTPQASAGVLLDWVIGILRNVAGSQNPAAAADKHIATIEDHKGALAAAVAANTAPPTVSADVKDAGAAIAEKVGQIAEANAGVNPVIHQAANDIKAIADALSGA